MLQDNFFASEQHYVCDVCSEAVTNPICPMCLATEIDAWLTFYPNLRQELIPKMKHYLKEIEAKIYYSTRCIKCKDKIASVCPYCFTEFVLRELKKIHVNNIILKEFIEFFNFNNHPSSPHAKKWGYKQII